MSKNIAALIQNTNTNVKIILGIMFICICSCLSMPCASYTERFTNALNKYRDGSHAELNSKKTLQTASVSRYYSDSQLYYIIYAPLFVANLSVFVNNPNQVSYHAYAWNGDLKVSLGELKLQDNIYKLHSYLPIEYKNYNTITIHVKESNDTIVSEHELLRGMMA